MGLQDEDEYSLDSDEEDNSEADLAVVVEIVGDRQRDDDQWIFHVVINDWVQGPFAIFTIISV